MRHFAAYALLVLGGNESPSVEDVENILKASGCTSNTEEIKTMVEAFKGKPFHELVKEGHEKIASFATVAAAPVKVDDASKSAPIIEDNAVGEAADDRDDNIGNLFGDDSEEDY